VFFVQVDGPVLYTENVDCVTDCNADATVHGGSVVMVFIRFDQNGLQVQMSISQRSNGDRRDLWIDASGRRDATDELYHIPPLSILKTL
jgi:hypothetical protein